MTAVVTDNLPLAAGAPNGIAKLRELIQELALRGKLVSQDAADESASELLAQIAAEKSSLPKPTKPLGSVSAAEQRHAVPHGWAWARLGSLVLESGAGWSPSCEPRPREGGEWGVLKVSAVSWAVYKPEENKALPASLEPRPEHEVQPGDFLVSRANTAELVARSVVVDSTPPRLMLSDKIVRLKLSQSCNRIFVNLANSCPDARRYYGAVAGGTSGSMKNVSREQILNLPVPVAPLAEQHRIVAKVDELMALCDRLEAEQADAEAAHAKLVEALLASLTQARDAADFRASWQQLAEHFHTLFTTEASVDALKQTVLQLGVMGRLVPQLSSDEPASVLLDRAHQARQLQAKRGRSPRFLPSADITDNEMLFDLPVGWAWTRKGNVLQFLNGYAFKSEWFKPEGTRLLRNVNIGHGSIDWKECASIHPDQAGEFGDFELQANDLVLSLDRPIISTGLKVAIVKEADLPCLLLQRVAKLSAFADCVSTSYLFIWLNSPFFTASIDPGRSNGVPHISTAQVAKTPFALPPLAEQERIVAKVEELLKLCDQLKLDLARSQQHHARLASTLVERAVA